MMYVPKHHEETDVSVLQPLVRAHPLGAWVTQGEGELIVNHVPFLLDPSRGELGTLVGHVARANCVWQSFSRTVPSVVIFQGAESYITPSWYPSKHAHGKAVPTWNYVVVHAHGLPFVIEDKVWLFQHVTELTSTHEAAQALPWKVTDAPVEFTERMIERIVGIEIPIAKLAGKWKVSQRRMSKRIRVQSAREAMSLLPDGSGRVGSTMADRTQSSDRPAWLRGLPFTSHGTERPRYAALLALSRRRAPENGSTSIGHIRPLDQMIGVLPRGTLGRFDPVLPQG